MNDLLIKGNEYVSEVFNKMMWLDFLWTSVRIMAIFIAGKIIVTLVHKALDHSMKERENSRLKLDTRRTHTITKLIKNMISYVVYFIVLLTILSLVGIDLRPLLAGAGVLGLAIGFGAQSLVKDVISGFFIIFEDQFAVGDTIQTGTYKGTVELIGLRSTRLKSWTGEVHFIPNGSINQVTNYSLNNSVAVVDVTISSDMDIDLALLTIKQTIHHEQEMYENLIKPPEVLGIQSMGASDVVIRVIAECKTNTHLSVARKLNVEIKKALDRLKQTTTSENVQLGD